MQKSEILKGLGIANPMTRTLHVFISSTKTAWLHYRQVELGTMSKISFKGLTSGIRPLSEIISLTLQNLLSK